MGFLEDVGNRLKSEATYKASSGASNAIVKAGEKLFKKGDKNTKCPKCKAPITPGLKFCSKCGAKLMVTCKKCNVDYSIGTTFCAQCGGKL
ncbi:MAG: zinc ribbon domain-containing protein [Nanoarchaeota archaeon]|nr:zinc ribbon domain-containing protein [Nanoarchaeota archaeon]MBU4124573.1 zinc ribbon domain-containing protein [Nanoarchaeota archaeon]